MFVGYYNNLKAYRIWIPKTNTVLKARDVIFNESNHIKRVTIHTTDNDDLPDLWTKTLNSTFTQTTKPSHTITHNHTDKTTTKPLNDQQETDQQEPKPPTPHLNAITTNDTTLSEGIYEPVFAPKYFKNSAWLNPNNSAYGQGKQTETQ